MIQLHIFLHFTKGNNFPDFLFASKDDLIFPKRGIFFKERANSFL